MDTSGNQYVSQFRQAIAYCLAYELRKPGLDPVALCQAAATYDASTPSDDLAGRILYYADLVARGGDASGVASKAEMTQHALYGAWQQLGFKKSAVIGLVYGGATKIKGYVFESARLPEVRGASALLDRINTLDIRALWGETFEDDGQGDRKERARQVREQYQCLASPQCLVYAGGGNFLAFAPLSVAQRMADQVEQLYTRETLVANTAAVAGAFSLLELVYGRQPDQYWLGDFQAQRDDEALRPLLESYYGGLEDENFLNKKNFAELVTVLASEMMRRRAGWGDTAPPVGEGGDERDARQRRYIPHYELLPYAVKCHSCDVRPAVIRDAAAEKEYCEPCARKRVAGQVAKKQTGKALGWFYDVFEWRPTGVISWEQEFNDFLDDLERAGNADLKAQYYQPLLKEIPKHLDGITRLAEDEHQTIRNWMEQEDRFEFLDHIQGYPDRWDTLPLLVAANDLNEIGHASSPQRYVGLIYADGNDVGARIAGIGSAADGNDVGAEITKISSVAKYIAFSRSLEGAARDAVFEALAEHLSPVWIEAALDPERPDRRQMWVHPWEIITIGGDDLIVIVPGHKALDVALSIGKKFEERLGDKTRSMSRYADQRYRPRCRKEGDEGWVLQDKPVTRELGYVPTTSLSAGVVVAHATTPIFFLWDLAEALIHSAKRWRKAMIRRCEKEVDTPYKGGSVDFMALKSVGMVASRLSAFRRRAFEVEDRYLTARPYTWVELEGLLQAARALSQSRLGRSQIYRMQDFLMEGQHSASVNYLYAFSRLRPEHKQVLACAFDLAWHRQGDVPPWRRRPDGKLETIWRDLVEIYDFVEEDEDAQV
jgi:CRISPR-associated protein Cmr2